uniref:Uncharacterized protein n=1 Tax=Arundo donax TaxID=35708 RepID=A0A0A9GMG0_ARUDO
MLAAYSVCLLVFKRQKHGQHYCLVSNCGQPSLLDYNFVINIQNVSLLVILLTCSPHSSSVKHITNVFVLF